MSNSIPESVLIDGLTTMLARKLLKTDDDMIDKFSTNSYWGYCDLIPSDKRSEDFRAPYRLETSSVHTSIYVFRSIESLHRFTSRYGFSTHKLTHKSTFPFESEVKSSYKAIKYAVVSTKVLGNTSKYKPLPVMPNAIILPPGILVDDVMLEYVRVVYSINYPTFSKKCPETEFAIHCAMHFYNGTRSTLNRFDVMFHHFVRGYPRTEYNEWKLDTEPDRHGYISSDPNISPLIHTLCSVDVKDTCSKNHIVTDAINKTDNTLHINPADKLVPHIQWYWKGYFELGHFTALTPVQLMYAIHAFLYDLGAVHNTHIYSTWSADLKPSFDDDDFLLVFVSLCQILSTHYGSHLSYYDLHIAAGCSHAREAPGHPLPGGKSPSISALVVRFLLDNTNLTNDRIFGVMFKVHRFIILAYGSTPLELSDLGSPSTHSTRTLVNKLLVTFNIDLDDEKIADVPFSPVENLEYSEPPDHKLVPFPTDLHRRMLSNVVSDDPPVEVAEDGGVPEWPRRDTSPVPEFRFITGYTDHDPRFLVSDSSEDFYSRNYHLTHPTPPRCFESFSQLYKKDFPLLRILHHSVVSYVALLDLAVYYSINPLATPQFLTNLDSEIVMYGAAIVQQIAKRNVIDEFSRIPFEYRNYPIRNLSRMLSSVLSGSKLAHLRTIESFAFMPSYRSVLDGISDLGYGVD